jgi:hypothetical protein
MSKAIFSIFKNEAPYLKEWVAFHKLQGFEKFYLYNNESSDNWKEQLEPFIKNNLVEVIDWPGQAQQLPAYLDFINNIKFSPEKPRWTAFIDIDEFIYSTNGEKVSKVLDNNEKYDCVIATWLMFGFNGYKEKPAGLVIDNFTKRAPSSFKENHFKSILDVGTINGFSNPHEFTINGTTANLEELKINHYWTKSQEEWEEKWRRGRSDTGERHNLEASLEDIKNFSQIKDLTIKNIWSEQLNKFIKEINE